MSGFPQLGTTVFNQLNSGTYAYSSLINPTSSFSGLVDIDAFSEASLKAGFLSKFDVLNSIHIFIQATAGVVSALLSTNLSWTMVPYDTLPILVDGIPFQKQLTIDNASSLDYCNFSGPAPPVNSQLTLGYLYSNTLNNTMKCSVYAGVGFLDGAYSTPLNSYNLPLDSQNNYDFSSTMSFNQGPQSYPSNGSLSTLADSSAACWSISLRDDYDSATSSFLNITSGSPTR